MPADPSNQARVKRRLYKLLLPYRGTVVLGFACLLVSVAAELYPPLVWQRVVDRGLAQRDWVFIGTQLVLLIVVFGVGQLFSAWRGLLLERAGQRLTLDLRQRLYEQLQRQSAHYYEGHRTGDLVARVTSDVDAIQDVLVRGTDAVLANALRILGVAGIFIALHPTLGLLVLLPMLAVGVLLGRFNRTVKPTYRAARNRLGLIAAFVTERVTGMRVVQSFAREPDEAHELARLGEQLYREQLHAVRARNRTFPLVRFVSNFGNVLMLGGGVYFILQGSFTLGGLLAYRGYGRYFYGPIDDLVSINDLLQRASASGQRIFEVLDAPVTVEDHPDARPLARPVRGDLRFEGVTFGYDAARPVLRDVSLSVRAGERVAVLGASGAGKSTLLGLVTRVHDPQGGRVTLDGRDVRDVTLASLRRHVGMMHQDTYLFHATVAENVRYARPSATDREVDDALRAANALEFVSNLPAGRDTMVGERGVKLSGGQRQRLSIARTVLAQPEVLLLDEPTSAVDAESEAIIVQALERLMRGRTALIVTHRLSLAAAVDRVIVMDGGRVAEEGSPDELRGRNGRYAALIRAANASAAD